MKFAAPLYVIAWLVASPSMARIGPHRRLMTGSCLDAPSRICRYTDDNGDAVVCGYTSTNPYCADPDVWCSGEDLYYCEGKIDGVLTRIEGFTEDHDAWASEWELLCYVWVNGVRCDSCWWSESFSATCGDLELTEETVFLPGCGGGHSIQDYCSPWANGNALSGEVDSLHPFVIAAANGDDNDDSHNNGNDNNDISDDAGGKSGDSDMNGGMAANGESGDNQIYENDSGYHNAVPSLGLALAPVSFLII